MQRQTCSISQIDNGFIVQVHPLPAPGTPGPGGPTVFQFCADMNAVAQYLVDTFVPGATFTPAPAAAPATTTTTTKAS